MVVAADAYASGRALLLLPRTPVTKVPPLLLLLLVLPHPDSPRLFIHLTIVHQLVT